MNRKQRNLLVISLACAALTGLFPHWHATVSFHVSKTDELKDFIVREERPRGYRWIGSPPEREPEMTLFKPEINLRRLAVQWIVLGFLTAAVFLVLGGEKEKRSGKKNLE